MLRVMTFNVRYREANDGPNRWSRRKALALARIRAFEPDLLGMQECSAGPQAEYFRRHLRAWEFHGVPTEDGDWPIEMAPILIKRGVFEMIATGHFWLSETPKVPGTKSWDAAFARTVTWARLRHLATGRSLVFVNTHLDYEPRALKASAQLLGKWLEQRARRLAVVVTGDFNADKRSMTYRQLTRGAMLFDAFRQADASPREAGSFHAFGTLNPSQPIDWILVSRHFSVESADVDRLRKNNRFPSDHYPVTAVIEWKRVFRDAAASSLLARPTERRISG